MARPSACVGCVPAFLYIAIQFLPFRLQLIIAYDGDVCQSASDNPTHVVAGDVALAQADPALASITARMMEACVFLHQL